MYLTGLFLEVSFPISERVVTSFRLRNSFNRVAKKNMWEVKANWPGVRH